MSDALKWLISIGGVLVIALAHVVFTWRSAERNARKEIEKLTPPTGVSLGDAGIRWLIDRMVQCTRLSAVTTGILSFALGLTFVALLDVPVVREAGPMYFMFAFGAGYLIGSTIATASSARAGVTTRRSAALTVRTSRTYLRAWERWLQSANLAASAIGFVIAGWLWLDGALSAFYFGLAATWLSLLALLVHLQRWVLRTPPVVDEELHVARELMIAVSVRTLARYQLVWASLIGFVGATYLWLHSDLPWLTTMTPLYAAGAVGLCLHLASENRRARGDPAPEWHFARTLGTTS